MTEETGPNIRDTKLIDWLYEAYEAEVRLQAALNAQIALIDRAAYRKRVQAHLAETQEHERLVAARIEELGGRVAGAGAAGVVSAVGEAASKAFATAKGQFAARTLTANGPDGQLRVATEQLRDEQLEIAIYIRIAAFADEVGDAKTAKLTRTILRDEERMAKFLVAELPKLVRDFVRHEIPREQRVTSERRGRSRPAARSRSRSTGASTPGR